MHVFHTACLATTAGHHAAVAVRMNITSWSDLPTAPVFLGMQLNRARDQWLSGNVATAADIVQFIAAASSSCAATKLTCQSINQQVIMVVWPLQLLMLQHTEAPVV